MVVWRQGSMLKKTKVKEFKKILTRRLNELLVEAEEAARDISTAEKDRFSDPTDRAVAEIGSESAPSF